MRWSISNKLFEKMENQQEQFTQKNLARKIINTSQRKKGNEEKCTSTIKKKCKAQIYARFEKKSQGEEKLIIKKINNSHNHSPLSDNEYKTVPQAIDLSENVKAEALKYFQEREKITTVVQTVIQKCYSDFIDTIIISTLKIKVNKFFKQ